MGGDVQVRAFVFLVEEVTEGFAQITVQVFLERPLGLINKPQPHLLLGLPETRRQIRLLLLTLPPRKHNIPYITQTSHLS